MLVQGTDLRKAILAVAVMMVAASLQGMVITQVDEETLMPGLFCSEDL